MNLLFLSPELLTPGGMQRHDRLVTCALDCYVRQRGGRLSVYCLNDPPPDELPPEFRGLEATTLRYFVGKRAEYVRAFVRAARRASLVIYGLLGFAPLARVQRVVSPDSRNLLFLHGREAWQLRSRFHSWGVHAIGSFVSISQYTLRAFRTAYDLAGHGEDFILPNPVDPKLLTAATDIAGRSVGPATVLSVARLSDRDQPKGIDSVIRALPVVLRKFPELIYVVVGDGKDRARLEALARDLKISHAVRFLGIISEEELKRQFAACDLFALPSTQEGFGFVFVEAMAYGKPVVAARATAVPEVVEHGSTGLLVEPGDVEGLAEAISLLAGDTAMRREMGLAGKQAVHRQYTYAAFQDRLFSICDSVIGRRSCE